MESKYNHTDIQKKSQKNLEENVLSRFLTLLTYHSRPLTGRILSRFRSLAMVETSPFYTEKRVDLYMPLAYSFSMQTVVETPMYLRAAEAIYSEADREEIVRTIAAYPEAGDLMPGTGGYRKLRFARSGMGKRGGARVVYLYGSEDLPIFLITVYAKSEKGNLSKAEQNALAKMAKSFFADYRGKR